ncbi:hypothetical protein H6G97_46985 [Nostoc flagelliforme FACHB-838]|uniref:Uncharacterized protein n=1 Tax=Nostoc flagelliforme FACHB-838 TaxID=2692904 RepID=A0ABR8E5R6_9NOSO|nr:hypothetical protein [Nostoc flagelliforme]MBD2536427.1 hypothetical protein [Nostoc flagelliforme FACHB-838]
MFGNKVIPIQKLKLRKPGAIVYDSSEESDHSPHLSEDAHAIALTPQPFAQAKHQNVPPFFKEESSLYGENNC